MELVLQVLMIVALLICDSRQLGTGDASKTNPRSPQRVNNGYNTGMGPYDVVVNLIRRCPGSEQSDLFKDNLEAYNKKTDNGSKIMYRGSFTMPLTQEEIESLELKVEVFRQKNNKEFTLANVEDNLCKLATGPGNRILTSFRKELGLKGSDCALPKGNYSFNDLEAKPEFPPPVMEYGRYRATLETIFEKKTMTCYELFGEAKQKT